MKVTKTDLIVTVAESAGIPKAAAEKALSGVLGAIAEALAAGGRVALPGFGTFDVLGRGARKGRNPRTGEPVDVPAAKVARFRPGKELAERVR